MIPIVGRITRLTIHKNLQLTPDFVPISSIGASLQLGTLLLTQSPMGEVSVRCWLAVQPSTNNAPTLNF
jgi:hypothetical protein